MLGWSFLTYTHALTPPRPRTHIHPHTHTDGKGHVHHSSHCSEQNPRPRATTAAQGKAQVEQHQDKGRGKQSHVAKHQPTDLGIPRPPSAVPHDLNMFETVRRRHDFPVRVDVLKDRGHDSGFEFQIPGE